MLELFMDVGKLVDINDEKKGLARHLQLSCTACLCSHTFFSSKRTDLSKKNKTTKTLRCECQIYLWMQKNWQTLEINEVKKVLVRHLQLSYTVCLYSHIFFTSKQINRPKKNNGRQNLYNVNVRAIYGCTLLSENFANQAFREILLISWEFNFAN